MSYVLITLGAFVVWFLGAVFVGLICTSIDQHRAKNDHSQTSQLLVAGWNLICVVFYILALMNA